MTCGCSCRTERIFRILRPLSRAGYRPLLEAGVRVFEWNGTMLHAKTAVADGRWARVGSTNLNVASWFGNCELDAVIEDEPFAREMEEMYLQDLENATEIVLDAKQKVRAPGEPRHPQPVMTQRRREAAGARQPGRFASAMPSARRSRTGACSNPSRRASWLTVGVVLLALAILFA